MIRPACLEAIAPCQAEKLWTPRRPFASLFLHPRRLGAYVLFSASHRFADLNAGRSQHIISDLLKHNMDAKMAYHTVPGNLWPRFVRALSYRVEPRFSHHCGMYGLVERFAEERHEDHQAQRF